MRTKTKSTRKDALLSILASLCFILAAGPKAPAAQSKYRIGDRVECDPSQIGQFKPGTIVDFPKNETERSGRFFYVLLDGSHITEGYLCMATHMRAISGAPPATQPASPRADPRAEVSKPRPFLHPPAGRKAPTSPALTIPMNGGVPLIPGTAWKMDLGVKRGNVQRILFCKKRPVGSCQFPTPDQWRGFVDGALQRVRKHSGSDRRRQDHQLPDQPQRRGSLALRRKSGHAALRAGPDGVQVSGRARGE